MDGRIAQLISKAEHHISHQEYEKALACLVAAEQIEPNNPSVKMLKELLSSLQSQSRKKTLFMRFFTRRVRTKSESDLVAVPVSSSELHRRISKLTGTADQFLARGAVESAYESMMRASALDPTSPEVVACERRVIPAWKKLHQDTSFEGTAPIMARRAAPPKRIQNSLLEKLKNGKLLT